MPSSTQQASQATEDNTVQVFVGSIVDYADLANAALAAPLLGTGDIGLDSMTYQLVELVLAHDPAVAQLAATWAGSGSGTQEESESSGLYTGTVTLENTSDSTVVVPVEGATVSTANGLAFEVVGNIHVGNWVSGSDAGSLGSYVVAPGASITVPVIATAFGAAYGIAANTISAVSVAGLSVTSSTEMDYGLPITAASQNDQTGFLTKAYGQYTTIFNASGFYPAESHVNVDDSHEWTSLQVASWEGYVDHSRSVGILNVAPIITDNNYALDLDQPFATGAWFAGLRQAALYSGGIAFDEPPSYFLARTLDAYEQNVVEMVRWSEQNGLRSTMLLSPAFNDGYDPDWASDTLQMLTYLKSQDALPDQIEIENYRSGSSNMYDASYTDPNSINALALLVQQFGLNAPTPSEAGLEVKGTDAAETDVIVTGMQQTQNYQSSGSFRPFAITQLFDQASDATISIGIRDGASLLSLSDVVNGASVSAGGELSFSGTAAEATTFLRSLVASASPGANGIAQLGLTITDQAGRTTEATAPVYVGVLAPVITGLSASATSTGYLHAGDVMTWKVSVSETLVVHGAPSLLLSNQQQASYQGQDADGNLMFSYTVWQNEIGADVTARALLPNDATLENASGYALDVDGLDPYVGLQPGFDIQTYPTSITSVLEGTPVASPDGGSAVWFTLGASGPLDMTASGTPTVTMSDGGTAIYAGLSANGQLVFAYALPIGERGAVAPVTLNLNGAAYEDETGHVLSGAITGSVQSVAVDTTGALILPGATTASDHVQLVVSEDAWNGDATFSVTVDGTVLPQTFTTFALHSAGQQQTIDIYGNFGGAQAATVGVTFLNGTWGGTVSTERNLYVQSIAYDGVATTVAQKLPVAGSTISVTPSAPSVAGFTADASASGILRAGDVITWTMQLDQPVTVTGTPILLLGGQQQATYQGQDASGALVFAFTVWQNEVATNFQASQLQLNGATVANAQGQVLNVASLAPYLASQPGFDIQTYPTTVTSVTEEGLAAGTDGGTTLSFTLGADLPLSVNSTGAAPTVTMSDGGTATYAGLTSTGQLAFIYALPVGEKRSLSPASLSLNGTSFVDTAGHWLWSTIPSSVAVAPVQVDTTGALILPGATAAGDHVQLLVSEDQWNGDATFGVTIDGSTLPETFTTSASHSGGQQQAIDIYGDFGSSTPTSVGVTFLNAAWGGTVSTERNLYVQSISYDGATSTLAQKLGNTGSAATATFQPSANDTVKLFLSEDAYAGDAEVAVTIDGKTVIPDASITASHAAGALQELDVSGNFGGTSASHSIGITFLNDAYGGSASTDRNAYVAGVAYDGGLTTSATELAETGSAVSIATAGSGDQLTLLLSEDAWQGDAQFQVTVNGQAVGAVQTVTASHAGGDEDIVTLSGHWGSASPQAIGLSFLNDAWGGTSGTDRNLYLDGAVYDNRLVNVSQELSFTSTATFSTALASAATGVAGSLLGSLVSNAAAPTPAGLAYASSHPVNAAMVKAAMNDIAATPVSFAAAPLT